MSFIKYTSRRTGPTLHPVLPRRRVCRSRALYSVFSLPVLMQLPNRPNGQKMPFVRKMPKLAWPTMSLDARAIQDGTQRPMVPCSWTMSPSNRRTLPRTGTSSVVIEPAGLNARNVLLEMSILTDWNPKTKARCPRSRTLTRCNGVSRFEWTVSEPTSLKIKGLTLRIPNATSSCAQDALGRSIGR